MAKSLRALRERLSKREGMMPLHHPLVLMGMTSTLLLLVGGFSPAFLPPADSWAAPPKVEAFLYAAPWRFVATFCIALGLAGLFTSWRLLRTSPRRGELSWIWIPWSLPLLLPPPLFSRDAYSYAAQGLIVSRGMNPYGTGPVAVPGGFADQVDPLWLFTAAPYGPLSLQLQRLLVEVVQTPYLSAVAMRLPSLLAMMLLAIFLPKVLKQLEMNVSRGLWWTVQNPLFLMHLVGGAHNEGLMLAFMVMGLHYALQGRFPLAYLFMGLSGAVKQTGLLALMGIAGLKTRQDPSSSHLKNLLITGVATMGVFAAVTWCTGLSWGWVKALGVPMSITSLHSPLTLLLLMTEGVLGGLGVQEATVGVLTSALREGATFLLLGVLGVLTWHQARRDPLRATLLAFAAFLLLSVVVHPWYLLPLFLLVAVVPLQPSWRRPLMGVVLASMAYTAGDVAFGNGVWIPVVAVGVWGVWRLRDGRGALLKGEHGYERRPAKVKEAIG